MKRLIIGISGATGAIYGVRMLEVLAKLKDVETHLVMTRAAKMTIQVETPHSVKDVEAMANVVHDINNVGASISSGSFRTAGMIIAPCSMKSMGGIAHSIGGDLLVRAADVILKERKRLVLVARETPLHLGHLESMVALTRMGAPSSVARSLERLRDLGLVGHEGPTATGERYRIVDPIFAAWVRRQRPGSRAIPDATTTSTGQEPPSRPRRRRKNP